MLHQMLTLWERLCLIGSLNMCEMSKGMVRHRPIACDVRVPLQPILTPKASLN